MSEALAALRDGVRAVLAERGAGDVAEVVARADLELVGPGEAWTLGGRRVQADRVAVLLDARDFAWITADPSRVAALREAAAAAMRTPSTELAELVAVLRLPGLGRAWSGAYREAPRRPPDAAPPDPAAVLAAARALLEAEGHDDAAALAADASLERAAVPTGGPIGLARWALRLAPADYARAARDAAVGAHLARAVEAAATRADERVAGVELALRLPGDAATDP